MVGTRASYQRAKYHKSTQATPRSTALKKVWVHNSKHNAHKKTIWSKILFLCNAVIDLKASTSIYLAEPSDNISVGFEGLGSCDCNFGHRSVWQGPPSQWHQQAHSKSWQCSHVSSWSGAWLINTHLKRKCAHPSPFFQHNRFMCAHIQLGARSIKSGCHFYFKGHLHFSDFHW